MIFTDSGIILLRQDFREADRIVSLYTKEHGRINVRLPGVARSVGNLSYARITAFISAGEERSAR